MTEIETTENTEMATTTEVITEPETVKIRRHGRSVERDSLTFPDGEWTMKEAHALNNGVCHATVYHHVKKMVSLGLMIQTGTRKGNRGKATMLYRKVDPITVTDTTVDASIDQPF